MGHGNDLGSLIPVSKSYGSDGKNSLCAAYNENVRVLITRIIGTAMNVFLSLSIFVSRTYIYICMLTYAEIFIKL